MNKILKSPKHQSNLGTSLVTSAVLLLLLLVAASVYGAPLNGKALIVKGIVSATNPAGETRLLAKRDTVYHLDTITTAVDSFMVIKMEDKTKITVRPESVLVIGEFDLTEGEEKASVSLVKGALRTVTGLIGKTRPEAFTVSTGVVTIGIRGTDFVTRICGSDCAVEEKSIDGVDYISVTDPTLTDDINDTVPVGVYFFVEDGQIYALQCAAGSTTGCGTVDLDTGQAGFAGDAGFGIMSRVPLFIQHDPYTRFSEFSEEQLDALDVLQDDFSESLQCDVQG